MLGLIHMAFSAFGYIGKTIRDDSINNERINKAKNNNQITYLDANGVERSVSNGHKTRIEYNYITDERKIVDVKTGKVLKDITKELWSEKEEKRREEAIKRGKPTYIILSQNFDGQRYAYEVSKRGCEGSRFKDVETGEVYVKRGLGEAGIWYMKVTNGHLVKLTEDRSEDYYERYDRIRPNDMSKIEDIREADRLMAEGYRFSYSFRDFDWDYNFKLESVLFKTREEFKEYFNERQDRYRKEKGKVDYYNTSVTNLITDM